MAFRWRADDGPFIAVFGCPIPSSTKNPIKFGPPLTKLSGSAHDSNVRSCVHVGSKIRTFFALFLFDMITYVESSQRIDGILIMHGPSYVIVL